MTDAAHVADGEGVSRRSVFRLGASVASVAGVAALGQGGQALAEPAASDPSAPVPTPFGTPTPDNPTPGARITAVRGDRAGNWAQQTGSEVLARNGVVATSQPAAAQAGLRILQDGGNAADATVATAAALAVVEPTSTSLGGDGFAIYYSAADRRLYGLNAGGWVGRRLFRASWL